MNNRDRINELVYNALCKASKNYERINYKGNIWFINRSTKDVMMIDRSNVIEINRNFFTPILNIFSLSLSSEALKVWVGKLINFPPYFFKLAVIGDYHDLVKVDMILNSVKNPPLKVGDLCKKIDFKSFNQDNPKLYLENTMKQEEILNELLKEDLGVWFGTKKKPKGSKQPKGPWVNICRKDKDGKHPPCGRPEADSKGYPKCRAAGVAGKMSDSEKRSACQQKRSAEKKDPKVGTGNKPTMVSHKKKNESLIPIIKKILSEQYDSERIYDKNLLMKKLSSAPRHIKQIASKLKEFSCSEDLRDNKTCVRIPEVIFVYLTGRY